MTLYSEHQPAHCATVMK